MYKNKFRSVIYLKRFDNKIALLPFAVKSARGRTFTGNHCSNCVVMTKDQWIQGGLDTVMELLLQAPIEVSTPLVKWDGVPTGSIFKVEWENEHMTAYDMKESIRIETWVEKVDNETPKAGKVSIYPSWTPYRSGEVFNFIKMPPVETFLSEIKRLFRDKY